MGSQRQQQNEEQQPQPPSSSRGQLEARYKDLFNVALPDKAMEKQWPISQNHCLMRIALDHYCGRCWYDRWDQRKGAMASMSTAELQGVIQVAERMLQDGGQGGAGFVGELHRRSLAYRGKGLAEKTHEEPHGNPTRHRPSLQPQQQPWWCRKPKRERVTC